MFVIENLRLKIIKSINSIIFSWVLILVLSACAPAVIQATPTTEINQVATHALQTLTAIAEYEFLIETADVQFTKTPNNEAFTATSTSTPVISSTLINTTDGDTGEIIDITSLINADTIFPEAAIKIYRPGNFSRVISPFRITVDAVPAENNQIQIRLVGEDGRTLALKRQYVTVLSGKTAALFSTDLEFEIEAIAEAGRIEISTEDEFGNVINFNSIDVVLMSVGQLDIDFAGEFYGEIIVQQPFSGMDLKSDKLIVTGIAQAYSEKPLLLELIDDQGVVVGEGLATIVIPADSLIGLFVGEIEVKVSEPTQVRLIVSIQGARIPGISFAQSVNLTIFPNN